MLFEYDVIEAVCEYLQLYGYHIDQKLRPNQQGDDIIASKSGNQKRALFIEAKGETSSRNTSNRYGKPFSSSQVRVHVAEALFKTIEVLSRNQVGDEVKAGMAFPETQKHRSMIEKIKPILHELGIAIFWVGKDMKVQVESTWEL